MASIKLHARSGHDSADGTVSCDFRGDNAVHPPVDHHKTLWEIDPAPEDLVAEVLTLGPAVNRMFARLEVLKNIGDVLQLAGAGGSLRIGVWDE